MARAIHINGESLVAVRGPAGSLIANAQQLGLSDSSIRVIINTINDDIKIDAWGRAPTDIQRMNTTANVSMSLVDFDRAILAECVRLAMGGTTFGQVGRAGVRLGGGNALNAAGNNFITLVIYSPQDSFPWRFYASYLVGPPVEYPLGVERSVVVLNWRVIPYTTDAWNSGNGSADAILFDNVIS